MLSFSEMEMKFGSAGAYHCLVEIEKASCISSWQMASVDPEIRLANAMRVQDAMFQPATSMAA